MEDEIDNRMTKIKRHFKENAKLYIGVGIGLGVAGITVLIMREPHAKLIVRMDDGLTNKPLMGSFFGSNVNNVVTTIHKNIRGNPGFVTRCIETGELFANQGDAARAFNIPEAIMSKHLNHGRELIENLHFERIGVFS